MVADVLILAENASVKGQSGGSGSRLPTTVNAEWACAAHGFGR